MVGASSAPPYLACDTIPGNQPYLPVSCDIFELVIQQDATSFQAGYLGLGGHFASVIGDVATKFDASMCTTGFTKWYAFLALTISTIWLHVVEWVRYPYVQQIELYTANAVIWQRAEGDTGNVPALLPFQFRLTDDLPQCIHTPESGLTYTLYARLHHRAGRDLHTSTVIHPTRYTIPGREALLPYADNDVESNGAARRWKTVEHDYRYSLYPVFWSTNDPIIAHFWLERSVIRKTERVVLQVHIPPPHERAVVDESLQLKSVETALVRVTQSHPAKQVHPDARILAQVLANHTNDRSSGSTSADANPSAPIVHETLVAHGGKSCRFHSQRPIHLSFALRAVPYVGSSAAFDLASTEHGIEGHGTCETITQDTTLHSVHFVLIVRVVLLDAHDVHHDIVTGQLIRILPGPAGLDTDASVAPGERKHPVPGASSAHGKAAVTSDEMVSFFTDYPEYDGYNDAMEESGGRATSLTTDLDTSTPFQEVMMHDPSHVHFVSTHMDGPPPSMHEHVLDARLCDDLGDNPSYAAQLATANLEQPPGFDEANEPLQEYGLEMTPMDYTAPPAEEPPTALDGHSSTNASTLPPPYADASNVPTPAASPTQADGLPTYSTQLPLFFPPSYEA
ncbi:hypothetical protein MVES1_001981 [Malassezia vespertilionis]|uniref:Uncharacterized protein n=1 Tax=Malassezia vespertilionis TaxID=2020962 RepID=A0A2N1JBK7_9BASI|nr:uncharacterized protein MVES1_001981 [Malassezia vespertilionis]PKI83934.1 hypothetical protein MVES_001876 [Malassezia vespertilionis]WFD06627.1 hypothetical protein MVES1_001981 [Malassezia vespertilionis]